MVRLVVCALALLAASGLAEPVVRTLPHKQADNVFLKHQLDLMMLFYHPQEPNHVQEQAEISKTWSIEKNLDHYTNITAATLFVKIYEHGLVPRGLPVTVFEPSHKFELETIFNVLYSAKDYDTFYKTAVWLRDHVNEVIFVYAVSTAIVHRHDTQGIYLPPIYEIFPSFFFNGVIMASANRINSHGHWQSHDYNAFTWVKDNKDVVIKANMTVWPYWNGEESKLAYFTHDHDWNAFYYNFQLLYPYWLGGDIVPLHKDRRGELFWFYHKQLLARYYMERLSVGLGEIPEISWNVPVEVGYKSGLVYDMGVHFPERPSHYHLQSPQNSWVVNKVVEYERRIRDAIDLGWVVNSVGEHISIDTPEGIDILGRVLEGSVDSPNLKFYGDLVKYWKILLGDAVEDRFWAADYSESIPLIVPTVLDHYQTALRDPAFYMIWKRIMTIFKSWQERQHLYKKEELALPSVHIKDVEVDKLVTYFDNVYVNITNNLWMTEHEAKAVEDHVSVLVQRPVLDHKEFQIRIHVNSESAKTVVVRLFLAPKYDSLGREIPLHENTDNFFQFDLFTYDLQQGENLIKRDSTQNMFVSDEWSSGHNLFTKVEEAFHGKGTFNIDLDERLDGFPHRLLLPKGRVGGMPFVMMVHISEYRAPKVPVGTGYDHVVSLGVGSGARKLVDDPYAFPLNKPLYSWQVDGLNNFWFEDVLIYHKPNHDVFVPHY